MYYRYINVKKKYSGIQIRKYILAWPLTSFYMSRSTRKYLGGGLVCKNLTGSPQIPCCRPTLPVPAVVLWLRDCTQVYDAGWNFNLTSKPPVILMTTCCLWSCLVGQWDEEGVLAWLPGPRGDLIENLNSRWETRLKNLRLYKILVSTGFNLTALEGTPLYQTPYLCMWGSAVIYLNDPSFSFFLEECLKLVCSTTAYFEKINFSYIRRILDEMYWN